MDNETTQTTPPATDSNKGFAPTQIADAFDAAMPRNEDAATAEAQGQKQGAPEEDSAAKQHSESVYNGRLGAAMRENNSLKQSLSEKDAEIKRLQEQLAAQSKPKGVDWGSVPNSENFDSDTKSLIDAVAAQQKAEFDRQIAERDRRIEELSKARTASDAGRRAEETKAAAWREVEARNPGLRQRICGGGDLYDAWVKFSQEQDRATGLPFGTALGQALSRNYAEGMVRVVDEFVQRNNLARQHDGTGLNPTPPASKGAGGEGGVRDSNGRKVWPSKQAIFDEMERVSAAERRGSITSAERRKQLEALEDDARQGRYLK